MIYYQNSEPLMLVDIYNTEIKSFEKHPLSDKREFLTEYKQQNPNVYNSSFLNLRFIFKDAKNRIWVGCVASYLFCYT